MTQNDLAENPRGDAPTPEAEKPRAGRKRDHSRDPVILEAALDVLAETGYDGMTIEMVATRAKAGKATLYRRWASKSDLVLDAVSFMKAGDIDYADLPDTGSLRGDLIAIIKAPNLRDAERKLDIMAGVVSMITRDPQLAAAAEEAIVAPRAAVNRILFERAIARGEISAGIDLDTICTIMPALAAYRTLLMRRPTDRAFLIDIIDNVVLPAARKGRAPAPAQ